MLVAAAATDVEALTRAQTVKGWAFVLATSLLLFFMTRHEMRLFFKAAESQRAGDSNFRVLVENAPKPIFIQAGNRAAYLERGRDEALFGAGNAGRARRQARDGPVSPRFSRHHPRTHSPGQHGAPDPPRRSSRSTCRLDDSQVTVEVNSVPFEYGGESGALVLVRDITERKVAEEASQRFKLLVENSRDIILFIRRADGRILEANRAAAVAYGYSREELLTLKVQELRESDTVGLVPEQMARADAEGILFETVHRRKDGTAFPVEISSRGTTIRGVRTLISIGRDISERGARRTRCGRASRGSGRWPTPCPNWCGRPRRTAGWTISTAGIEEFSGFVKQADGSWEWSALVHPEDLPATVDAWGNAVRTGRADEIEHRLRPTGRLLQVVPEPHYPCPGRGGPRREVVRDVHRDRFPQESRAEAAGSHPAPRFSRHRKPCRDVHLRAAARAAPEVHQSQRRKNIGLEAGALHGELRELEGVPAPG